MMILSQEVFRWHQNFIGKKIPKAGMLIAKAQQIIAILESKL
jgi:hypothetical protein